MGSVLWSSSIPLNVQYDGVKQLLSNVFLFQLILALMNNRKFFVGDAMSTTSINHLTVAYRLSCNTIQLQSIHFIVKLSLVRLKHDHRLSEIINLVGLRKEGNSQPFSWLQNSNNMESKTHVSFMNSNVYNNYEEVGNRLSYCIFLWM